MESVEIRLRGGDSRTQAGTWRAWGRACGSRRPPHPKQQRSPKPRPPTPETSTAYLESVVKGLEAGSSRARRGDEPGPAQSPAHLRLAPLLHLGLERGSERGSAGPSPLAGQSLARPPSHSVANEGRGGGCRGGSRETGGAYCGPSPSLHRYSVSSFTELYIVCVCVCVRVRA